MARRSLSASYGPRNRTVSQSRTIFILSSRRCSSFHDYYLAERRRDDKRFVETVSLSLSRGIALAETTLSRTKRLRVASSPHRPRSSPSSGFFLFFFFRPKTRPKPRRWINRLFRCRAALRFIAWLIFRHGFISLKIFATRVRHYSTNWSQETEEEIFFFNMAILRFEYWISISDSFTLSILLLWFIAINRKNSSRRKKYLQRAEFNVHVAGNVRDFYRCVNNCVN